MCSWGQHCVATGCHLDHQCSICALAALTVVHSWTSSMVTACEEQWNMMQVLKPLELGDPEGAPCFTPTHS